MTEIRDMNEYDLAKELIGKTVVKIVGETMRLDDGTALEFKDTGSCCAWFTAQLHEGNLTDNAVTAIEAEEVDDDEAPEHYNLHILAADERVAAVEITGDPTNGYYCHSINLIVRKPS
jgi:hypothetical protein